MKISNDFLLAKKDKNVQTLIVKQFKGRQYIYLCIDTPIKYTDKKEMVYVESDSNFTIENFSGYYNNGVKLPIENICFHLSMYNDNFVRCFLNAIKKDSEVSFKVTAYNDSDNLRAVNWNSHQLYGFIDNKEYFLSCYSGPNNSASPISQY